MSNNNYYNKYMKYKSKYIQLRKQSGGGPEQEHQPEAVPVPALIDGDIYDPKRFLSILEENNIVPNDYSELAKEFPPQAIHVPFSKVMELIRNSCNKFVSQYDKRYPCVMVIPMFSEQAGAAFTKSNWWFSLLYLRELNNINPSIVSDVVILGMSNEKSEYFMEFGDDKIVNLLICDDGMYSGTQMHKTISWLLLNICIINHINQIHICVPFSSTYGFVHNEISKEDIFAFVRGPYLVLEDLISKIRAENILVRMHHIKKRPEVVGMIERFSDTERSIYKDIQSYQYYLPHMDIFRHFIFINVGEIGFNEKMDHWFDHKFPDAHSFRVKDIPRVLADKVKPPYKGEWIINGKSVDNNKMFMTYTNPNKLLFKPSHKEVVHSSNIECPLEDYSKKTELSTLLSLLWS
jgi:hypothetical protein